MTAPAPVSSVQPAHSRRRKPATSRDTTDAGRSGGRQAAWLSPAGAASFLVSAFARVSER
jgi:hypothetical protein